MVDFDNITEYDAPVNKLQEIIFGWICAAGKQARVVAPRLNTVLQQLHQEQNMQKCWEPFAVVRKTEITYLRSLLKNSGIGNHGTKSRSMSEISHSELDLQKCSAEDLLKIHGIGRKTANCFILHTRKFARVAGLDTHILKYLKDKGYPNVPYSTPTSVKEYNRLEQYFLEECDKLNRIPAEFDLELWKAYSQKDSFKIKELVS